LAVVLLLLLVLLGCSIACNWNVLGVVERGHALDVAGGSFSLSEFGVAMSVGATVAVAAVS